MNKNRLETIKMIDDSIEYKGNRVAKQPVNTEYGEWVGTYVSHENLDLLNTYHIKRRMGTINEAIHEAINQEIERAKEYFKRQGNFKAKLNSIYEKAVTDG